MADAKADSTTVRILANQRVDVTGLITHPLAPVTMTIGFEPVGTIADDIKRMLEGGWSNGDEKVLSLQLHFFDASNHFSSLKVRAATITSCGKPIGHRPSRLHLKRPRPRKLTVVPFGGKSWNVAKWEGRCDWL